MNPVRGALLAAAIAAVAAPGAARADRFGVLPPDAESFRREGFAFGVGSGPGVFIGTGSQRDFRGAGAAGLLRFGTAAGPRLQWTLGIDLGVYRLTSAAEEVTGVTNLTSMVTLGAQYFVREALFLKGGAGAAGTSQEVETVVDGMTRRSREKVRSGVALLAGAGVDVYRRRRFAIDLEVTVSTNVYQGGTVHHWGLATVLNWY